MWIFLALLAVPVIEIALFIQVGGWLGLWPTLGLVVLTAVLGTMILRVQGARAMMDIRQAIGTLSDPTAPLAHGAMILVAGVLLLTPGFFTDALGFALLIPPVRVFVIGRMRGRIAFHSAGFGAGSGEPPDGFGHRPGNHPDDRVIDGEFVEMPPANGKDAGRGHRPSGWTKD